MKVGDYVRTNDGIGKITKYKYEPEYENCHVIWFDNNDYGIRYIDGEIKSSPNIIDLIEVGDYVNGCLVSEIKDKWLILNYADIETYEQLERKNENIKSIVTKEQFEEMEYKL